MFVARVTPTYLAAARQRLLGPMSVYADQWDLVVRHKYMGRFTAATNVQGIAVSLAKSWNWRVIALQTKKAGKDHQVITFGSDQDPPFWQVAMNGEVTILSRIGENRLQFLPCFFLRGLGRTRKKRLESRKLSPVLLREMPASLWKLCRAR